MPESTKTAPGPRAEGGAPVQLAPPAAFAIAQSAAQCRIAAAEILLTAFTSARRTAPLLRFH
jgi:hypothetical protein